MIAVHVPPIAVNYGLETSGLINLGLEDRSRIVPRTNWSAKILFQGNSQPYMSSAWRLLHGFDDTEGMRVVKKLRPNTGESN